MPVCAKPTGLSPKINSQVQLKVNQIGKVFGGTVQSLVIANNEKQIIYHYHVPTNVKNAQQQQIEEVSNLIQNFFDFRNSSQKFVESFTEITEKLIPSNTHIKGKKTIFSSYELKDLCIAFYILYSGENISLLIENIDTSKVDKEMEPVLQEIQLLLDNAKPSK